VNIYFVSVSIEIDRYKDGKLHAGFLGMQILFGKLEKKRPPQGTKEMETLFSLI
jgi:hypothetical protein